MDDIAISVNNVTAIYRLYEYHADRFKEAFHHLRKKYYRTFTALNNVFFQVNTGDYQQAVE